MTEKKPDWILQINQNEEPVLVTRLELFYNPEERDTLVKLFNKEKQIRTVLLPLQPKEGSPKYEEYHK